jgi:protein-disulfide isomerase
MEDDHPTHRSRKRPGFNLSGFNPLVIVLIGAAFAVGVLWTKNQNLEKQMANNQGGTPTTGQMGQPTVAPAAGNQGNDQFGSADQVEPVSDNDWIKGSKNARVMLIEYSDLECPYCKRFHPTAQQAVDSYNGQVAWVFRHFPLPQLHPEAPKKAEAVECAGEQQGQEGFWKLVDKLEAADPAIALAQLSQTADSLGLDGDQLQTCIDSGKYTSKVSTQMQSGTLAGVTGTPGNILLDTQTGKTQLIPGAVPFDQLKSSIDALLASS